MNSCNICIRLFLCNGLCYFPWKPFMTHTQVDKYLCALTVGFPNSSYMIFPSLHGKQGCFKHLNCYREIGAFSQKWALEQITLALFLLTNSMEKKNPIIFSHRKSINRFLNNSLFQFKQDFFYLHFTFQVVCFQR